MTEFVWQDAFARNLPLLSDEEWQRVRRTRVGIGGLGGCGSNHLLALTRMGFEKFVIADPDVFDLSNLNRQAGASLATLGQPKVDVMRRMVLDINPAAEIVVYPAGLSAEVIPEFVSQADIGINAIDFFRVDLYSAYHDTFRAQGKYSIVGASPFAFGAAMTVIGPESEPFETVFDFRLDDSRGELLRKFVSTIAGSRLASWYLAPGVNQIREPVEDTKIGSSAAALHLCTALTAVEVLCIVTGRRPPTLAPETVEIDLLTQVCKLPRGSEMSRTSAPGLAKHRWGSGRKDR